ncbi:MAG: ATP-dependent Clp protease ATP-binding subunit [[Lactobacillus] timonensis]|jgi:ATP-dependent Clp protease ATP-binding subunit ClpC|uniref:ATP-dependent Clp protease ATP-binding subunit n=1 Tax=[Lactobacillus] timonensis TaxID=1970790 RepID=UPI002353FB9E|nr:ATP-dependent Clp protease ATP-binding subunit [[Lactobacillus] timonensis]MCI1926421.1 ATP-dependent Clp protease ATP-binding subunit [[Lactobacillus] timonensis]MCI1957819.1 ATP-dependent Clp protease ATP-binding subunit [[Lactobacillus] timonensis]MCI1970837.1 ATP-dependent Clp protease ATP-binding subunit [[Lactobacillus] timonensis]MCI2006983.1 ATP-dependent Clp protease ATP-binding subunit [[Lactobacillus] timonensis]
MNNYLTPSAKEVLLMAQEQARYFKHQAVGTEHLLLALTMESASIAGKVLAQFSLTANSVREEIERLTGYGTMTIANGDYLPYSPKMRDVLQTARSQARQLGNTKVGTEHLLMALLSNQTILAGRILQNFDINPRRAQQTLLHHMGVSERRSTKQSGVRPQRGQSNQKSSDQKADSLTPTLDKLGRDLTKVAREGGIDPVVGRDREIQRVIQVLSRRTKNNPVLVGEPGVGKTAIVEGLAQRIANHTVTPELAKMRVMALDMGSVVAGTKFRGEFEDRLKKILDEIYDDGHVLLFIDELHTLVGAGGAEGAIDASNILKPALSRGDVQLIGATTLDEYQKYIEADAALERRFARVQVEEPSQKESVQILKGLRPKYEAHHHLKISDESVETAVKLSNRYITNRFLPDKAIDLMDESAAMVRIAGEQVPKSQQENEDKLALLRSKKEDAIMNQQFDQAAKLRQEELALAKQLRTARKRRATSQEKHPLTVGADDVAKVVAEWTGVPLTQLKKSESQRLVNLEKELHERVIGQDEAVSAIARSIRRARSGLKDPQRPIGSFMFLGPTGVGKTELAKALAAAMFGDENNIIRVDMSEYREAYSTSRLIGAAPGYVGYDEGGQLTEKVRQHPYSVVLLDEAEKAHPDVFNLLLQVLDDGYLTDSKGRKVDFRNTILIMTSNLGATQLRDEKEVGFGARDLSDDYNAMAGAIRQQLRLHFRPEFLNRIDETIIFHPLNKQQLHQIVRLMAKRVQKRVAAQKIKLKLTAGAINLVAAKGYNPEYGARPLRRALQDLVEDPLSEALLTGQLASGDTATVGSSRGKITLKVAHDGQSATLVKV